MAGGQGNFGVAAFAPEDVEDARRGHPDVDLSQYATGRGLEYLGGRVANGFRASTASLRAPHRAPTAPPA